VNKSELIDQIAKAAGISEARSRSCIGRNNISSNRRIKKGDLVTLIGFGTFYVGKRAARNGRNPRTGATIKIKATNSPKFRAGKALKDAVN
jgi:DNA-binding protein HU-beta